MDPSDLGPVLLGVLDRINQESGIDFSGREPRLRLRAQWGHRWEGRIYYNGPLGGPGVARRQA